MGTSYKIFLTKSYDAATLIGAGLRAEHEKEGYWAAGFRGKVEGVENVPKIYHNCGYYCAMAEYKNPKDARERFEIIVC